jgi:MoaA/NifB/PqqE/SkfB family radical SAM enzyme
MRAKIEDTGMWLESPASETISPGRIERRKKLVTRSLEINLTAHCNLRCYGCGRGSPALAEEYLSVPRLAEDLAVLAKVVHVGEFKLAGGEPLQHPAILEIVDVVRGSGVADQITLITNGVLLHQAPFELWEKIDQMWVSIYPGVKRRLSRDEIISMGRKHRVKVWYKITDTFTRRVLNSENRDGELVREIYSDCYQRKSCHSIYNGRYYKCASGPFVPEWLHRIGIDAPDFSGDGVPLHNNPNLRQDLEDYLDSDTPLTACRFCLGGSGKSFENRQLNEDGIQDWLAEKHPDVRALIDSERLASAKSRTNGIRSVWGKMASGVFRALGKEDRTKTKKWSRPSNSFRSK